MAAPVLKQKQSNRVEFTLIDMIRALRGFRSPEGYVVIPNEIAEKIEVEITRLYEVEEMAISLADDVANGRIDPKGTHALVFALLQPE